MDRAGWGIVEGALVRVIGGAVILGIVLGSGGLGRAEPPSKLHHGSDRPNVLMIIVDDLNDWVGVLGGHPQARTPWIDRLASEGLLFTNAHCAAPLCNPSRTSTLLGLRPSTSGVLGNNQDWRTEAHLEDVPTLPEYFRQRGYFVAGGGKIFHANHGGETGALTGGHGGRSGFGDPSSWDERFPAPDVQVPMPAVLAGQNYNGLDIWHWDWGPIDIDDPATIDGRTTDWAVDVLERDHDRPFFLTVGIYRPHGPWYVPRPYFERRPLDRITLPIIRDDDLDDIPAIATGYYFGNPNNFHVRVTRNNLYAPAVQAYLACIDFADVMIGRVLSALESSPHAEDTIVVLWSDHGWHLGEKLKWHKSTLWEEATRVPLIVRAPGVTRPGTSCRRPASLVDLYPTLVDLCGLEPNPRNDGRSLRPWLVDPDAPRPEPALTSRRDYRSGRVHHSVRSERWRYTRYADGSTELYDHEADPSEWTNLTNDPTYAAVRAEQDAWLERLTAPPR